MELLIWRSVSSLETAPMWVSPTHVLVLRNLDSKSRGTIPLTYVGEGGDYEFPNIFLESFCKSLKTRILGRSMDCGENL